MMLHDGSIVTCDRSQNTELFNLAMGGLWSCWHFAGSGHSRLVENKLMTPTIVAMPSEKFAEYFVSQVNDPKVAMAYGRLDVARASFFKEALAISYRALPTPADGLAGN